MKKIITAGFTVLALMGPAAEAQAFDWSEAKSKTFREFAWGDSCADADHLDVWVSGARNLEPVSPLPGHQITGNDLWDGYGPVQVTSVERKHGRHA